MSCLTKLPQPAFLVFCYIVLYFPVDDKWIFLVGFFLTVFVTGSYAPYGHFCLLVKSSLLPVYLAKPGGD